MRGAPPQRTPNAGIALLTYGVQQALLNPASLDLKQNVMQCWCLAGTAANVLCIVQ